MYSIRIGGRVIRFWSDYREARDAFFFLASLYDTARVELFSNDGERLMHSQGA